MSKDALKNLDAALESCLSLIDVQGLSLDDCLERYPHHREELRRLLPVAIRLKQGRSLIASESLGAGLAARLQEIDLAQSEELPGVFAMYVPALRSIFRTQDPAPQRRALMIPALITFAMVFIFSMGGLVASADAASPGDLLFGLDTAIEDARLSFANDEEKEVELHIEFATERLEELKSKIEGEGDQQDIEAAQLEFKEALAALEALLGGLTPEQRAAFEDAFAALIASRSDLGEFEFELEVEDGKVKLEVEIEPADDLGEGDLEDGNLDEGDLEDDDLDDDLDEDENCDSADSGSDDCSDDGPDDGDPDEDPEDQDEDEDDHEAAEEDEEHAEDQEDEEDDADKEDD